jgi:uncharacterized protein YcbX
MDAVGEISRLWRYPASSCAGEQRPQIDVAAAGVAGDRLFGAVEALTREPARPDRDRRWHPLPRVATRLGEAGLEIAVPGGHWIAVPSAEADQALSDLVGFDV